MRSAVIFIVCAIFTAAYITNVTSEDKNEGFINLSHEQRECIRNKAKADDTIMAAITVCHYKDEGFDCVKGIAELSACFA